MKPEEVLLLISDLEGAYHHTRVLGFEDDMNTSPPANAYAQKGQREKSLTHRERPQGAPLRRTKESPADE